MLSIGGTESWTRFTEGASVVPIVFDVYIVTGGVVVVKLRPAVTMGKCMIGFVFDSPNKQDC